VRLNAKVVTEPDLVAATAKGSFGEYQIDADFRVDSLISLQGLDATIRSRGPSIRSVGALMSLSHLPDKPYPLDARALQTKQGSELEHFRLKTTGLNIDAAGKAKAIPEFRDIDLHISAAGSDFSAVAQFFKRNIDIALPFQLVARVTDNGPGDDDVDATLDGFVWIVGSEGRTPRTKLGPLVGDLFVGIVR